MAKGKFSLDLRKFVQKAQGNADQVVRKVALDVFRGVVLKTPVDTGRARGSWGLGVNTLEPGPHERFDPEGAAAIGEALAKLQGVKAGGVIFVASNLSYINELEFNHHSKQAPNGMVRITVMEYQTFINKAVQELDR